jgi:hypothetical protein
MLMVMAATYQSYRKDIKLLLKEGEIAFREVRGMPEKPRNYGHIMASWLDAHRSQRRGQPAENKLGFRRNRQEEFIEPERHFYDLGAMLLLHMTQAVASNNGFTHEYPFSVARSIRSCEPLPRSISIC